MTDAPLWEPPAGHIPTTELTRFRQEVERAHSLELPTSIELHRWSVSNPGDFWMQVWDAYLVGDQGPGPHFVPGDSMVADRYFPEARINYAENLLAGATRANGGDDSVAVTFVREDDVRRSLTWRELRTAAAQLAAFLQRAGVEEGDRVAAWLPNNAEAIVSMLATSMLGAVFTSTSPDFGVAGVLDRFGQVEPKVLIAVDGYFYAGKPQPRLDRLAEVVGRLPSLKAVVVVEELAEHPTLSGVPGAVTWRAALAESPEAEPSFVRQSFDAPGFILYSSGTTGVPKCIVHRGAGVMLKHAVEHRLQCDVRPNDVVFYFTTCGWMMWNWLASALATGAQLVLYDGSPFHPSPARLWDLVDEFGITLFGTSAKYLDASRKAGLHPAETHQLRSLRTITSTGSPLVPEGFHYVYEHIKADVHLASISGGTDICGCFVAGDPTRPVYAGEIQGPGFGMAVDVYDQQGQSLAELPGVRGELVCTVSFPSMPIEFWNDGDGAKYQAAYFDRFPGVWAQGDFASWTEHAGIVIHGRSDATLNAGGVRIGTAEIYRQVEALPEVVEALAIGQNWDDDTRIVLFVRLANGFELDDALASTIKRRLRENGSPRHVPARIIAVTDMPRTRSNKLAELAVADVVHGREVRNVEALANPEALALFRDLPALAH
ncbi:MAG: acetoacetate--CoA ligase [Candidatus Nanopelagicales bacterium]